MQDDLAKLEKKLRDDHELKVQQKSVMNSNRRIEYRKRFAATIPYPATA
jgi:hypothetical protein